MTFKQLTKEIVLSKDQKLVIYDSEQNMTYKTECGTMCFEESYTEETFMKSHSFGCYSDAVERILKMNVVRFSYDDEFKSFLIEVE